MIITLKISEKGKLAAQTFLASLSSQSLIPGQKDTIDIVCHSMGYAYSLGFIEYLKDKVIWGRMYILAPENACSGGADWSKFEEVWQYGSNNNEGDPDRDPFWLQDGVAPQCAVKGIEEMRNILRYGRAYIPPTYHVGNGPLGQFDGRHYLHNYMWIFTIPETGPNNVGHVKKR